MRRIVYHEIGSYRKVLADPSRPRYAAWDARIKYADNNSGEMSITIAPDNPEYQALASLVSELVVEDDGVEIWRGRMLEPETDIYGRLRLTVKGVLDYLHDTVQPAQTISGTAADVFSALIAAHNAKPVESRKKFVLGTVNVTAAVSNYKITAGAKTWEQVSKLVKSYGGHISVRRVDGKNYIDWIDEINDVCSQTVRLGENILDLKKTINVDDLSTVVYPYGKTTNGAALGIESVNGGLAYIVDEDAVAVFGWVESSYTDSSCADAGQLMADARAALAERIAEAKTITVSAVDLSDIGDAERIEINKLVPVVALPHGIDELMPCTALTRYLWEPQRTQISLGASMRAISAMIGGML